MGKSLRSSSAAANSVGNVNKTIEQLSDRLSQLEKKYSSAVTLHQINFKKLEEWIRLMFGIDLFTKKPEDVDPDLENEMENPFYRVHQLQQRMNSIEDELQSLGIDIPKVEKKTVKAPQIATKGSTKKNFTHVTPKRRKSVNTATPPVLKPSAVAKKSAATDVVDNKQGEVMQVTSSELPKDKDGADKAVESEELVDKDKPPVLEEIKKEPMDEDEEMETEVPPPGQEPIGTKFVDPTGPAPVEAEKMEEDEGIEEEDEEEEEEVDVKPDEDDLEYVVGRYTNKKIKETAKQGKGGVEEEQQVTYTTRGRRHTLPRRYAEYTGHDNVASILKSQQRSTASNGKPKKSAAVEKPKTPVKPKAPPKPVTPKKPDGSRPDCVYQLISDVQKKDVDEDGNVVLWDAIESVKVSQQQLISVIFRSNGMATRLTRKLTTLVFEDQVLANTSPFGTKYYQERLPPEPLEAMVEFISHSGFDSDYTKKKIYMVVGQVCNEARAGRVRKLLPTTSGGGSSNQDDPDYMSEPPILPTTLEVDEEDPSSMATVDSS